MEKSVKHPSYVVTFLYTPSCKGWFNFLKTVQYEREMSCTYSRKLENMSSHGESNFRPFGALSKIACQQTFITSAWAARVDKRSTRSLTLLLPEPGINLSPTCLKFSRGRRNTRPEAHMKEGLLASCTTEPAAKNSVMSQALTGWHASSILLQLTSANCLWPALISYAQQLPLSLQKCSANHSPV